MKVKIGDKIYDSRKEPIMLILSDRDKEDILNMNLDAHKFCSFPSSWDEKEIEEFMKL